MKNKIKGFILGVLVTCVVTSSIVIAAGKTELRTLTAAFSRIGIRIDQNQLIPKDVTGARVEPFIVDGTTYVPIRAIAEAFDKEVVWDEIDNRIGIFTKSETVTKAEVEKAFEEVYLSTDTLQDYKVWDIQKEDTNTWLVNYRVLPSAGYETSWMAGNGERAEDGWIINKTLYVYVIKTDGIVNLRVLGTGI